MTVADAFFALSVGFQMCVNILEKDYHLRDPNSECFHWFHIAWIDTISYLLPPMTGPFPVARRTMYSFAARIWTDAVFVAQAARPDFDLGPASGENSTWFSLDMSVLNDPFTYPNMSATPPKSTLSSPGKALDSSPTPCMLNDSLCLYFSKILDC